MKTGQSTQAEHTESANAEHSQNSSLKKRRFTKRQLTSLIRIDISVSASIILWLHLRLFAAINKKSGFRSLPLQNAGTG